MAATASAPAPNRLASNRPLADRLIAPGAATGMAEYARCARRDVRHGDARPLPLQPAAARTNPAATRQTTCAPVRRAEPAPSGGTGLGNVSMHPRRARPAGSTVRRPVPPHVGDDHRDLPRGAHGRPGLKPNADHGRQLARVTLAAAAMARYSAGNPSKSPRAVNARAIPPAPAAGRGEWRAPVRTPPARPRCRPAASSRLAQRGVGVGIGR